MQSKMFHPISLAHALPDNSYRLKDMEAASNDMPMKYMKYRLKLYRRVTVLNQANM